MSEKSWKKKKAKTIKKAIEEVYKIPFHLPRNFGRRKHYQITKKLKSLISKKHWNVRQKKEQTSKREKLYHDCALRNRNDTAKLIDKIVYVEQTIYIGRPLLKKLGIQRANTNHKFYKKQKQ